MDAHRMAESRLAGEANDREATVVRLRPQGFERRQRPPLGYQRDTESDRLQHERRHRGDAQPDAQRRDLEIMEEAQMRVVQMRGEDRSARAAMGRRRPSSLRSRTSWGAPRRRRRGPSVETAQDGWSIGA
jgi:hypothetical protein